MIWYNTPFSKKVKTNFGKQFLHLPAIGRNHKYYKIFSHNNVKISYNCMDSMKI